MRVLHWCMLGVTILLLVCEVTISQLCKSLIILVDGFHTLFILMRKALPPSSAGIMKPRRSPLDSPASPPRVSSSSAAPPATLPAELSIEPVAGIQSAAALGCCVSFSNSRFQVVADFISALLLASLCVSYIMEIISFSLEPYPVERPLLLVVVSAVSLLHKMLVLKLNWDQLQDERASRGHRVLAGEEVRGRVGSGPVLGDAVDSALHNGALVLCNPGTSSVPVGEPQVHLHAAAPQEGAACEAEGEAAHVSPSDDLAEVSRGSCCVGRRDSHNTSNTPSVFKSSHHPCSAVAIRRWPVCLVIQGLCTSILTLINSLVMLLVDPKCLHSSGACGLLVYLDPSLSLLAVITLVITAAPQVHRYALLLLQATPPHICVSDLGRRIASVPGVQAVHDLHVWQLTESFTVASVHVHCHAGFPLHRCADLMSGVTKVLHSVGVSCCTVQPEFASCSGSCAGSGGDASPVVHREDPSLPPPLTCSLACGKACAGNMCCSPLEEETGSLLAPAAVETKEEPQTLVIENTFL